MPCALSSLPDLEPDVHEPPFDRPEERLSSSPVFVAELFAELFEVSVVTVVAVDAADDEPLDRLWRLLPSLLVSDDAPLVVWVVVPADDEPHDACPSFAAREPPLRLLPLPPSPPPPRPALPAVAGEAALDPCA